MRIPLINTTFGLPQFIENNEFTKNTHCKNVLRSFLLCCPNGVATTAIYLPEAQQKQRQLHRLGIAFILAKSTPAKLIAHHFDSAHALR